MMALVLMVQVALPLGLLAWLALLPAGNVAGFVLQAAGTAAILFALARVAQWAVPVWWLPWVYGALWLVTVLSWLRGRNSGDLTLLPTGISGWSSTALAVLLLGIGGFYGGRALAGHSLPPVQVIDILNPFGPGRFLVGHGGSNALVNGHMRTLDATIERFRPWRWTFSASARGACARQAGGPPIPQPMRSSAPSCARPAPEP